MDLGERPDHSWANAQLSCEITAAESLAWAFAQINRTSDSTSNMAFAVKSDHSKRSRNNTGNYGHGTYTSNSNRNNSNARGYKGQKKERPFCTHCNFHGHTVERCYKLHGYPPGFKHKQRDSSSSNINYTAVNQVSDQDSYKPNIQLDQQNGVGNFFQSLNSNQCQQLMSMLSGQLDSSTKTATDQHETSNTSYTTDICFSVSPNPIFSSN
ncbi:Uncharacterized protein Adt_11420 [Abeliophyllum distichum]|uniref:Uncharacterized protein n=1 Tax=Abeliophyllum distichum TaxID=126358 RepID=A0ABD1UMT9_9LAMI